MGPRIPQEVTQSVGVGVIFCFTSILPECSSFMLILRGTQKTEGHKSAAEIGKLFPETARE